MTDQTQNRGEERGVDLRFLPLRKDLVLIVNAIERMEECCAEWNDWPSSQLDWVVYRTDTDWTGSTRTREQDNRSDRYGTTVRLEIEHNHSIIEAMLYTWGVNSPFSLEDGSVPRYGRQKQHMDNGMNVKRRKSVEGKREWISPTLMEGII